MKNIVRKESAVVPGASVAPVAAILRGVVVVALVAVMALFTGCKTTEENYRSAYEIALQKKQEGLSSEEITGFAREEAMPKTLFRGDSIPLRAMYVNCESGGIDGNVLTYNVIVASFKQKFNASSACRRLVDGGYPHAAMLVDKDERYYVVATTDSTLEQAVTSLKAIEKQSPVALRPPYPYILQKP